MVLSSSRIKEKVNEVAETLGLTNLLRKLALKLTADQKQLISLGRGLVRDDVAAVLMDEPLTVIDPDLKFRLRRKLKEINEKYKLTLIYVTHDQNEAMTFAEQIVVMDKGKIVQVGTPRDLFEKPETTFCGVLYRFTCDEPIQVVKSPQKMRFYFVERSSKPPLICVVWLNLPKSRWASGQSLFKLLRKNLIILFQQ